MDKNEILIRLSESKATKIGKEDFAQQSLPQKVFTAIWEAQGEVCNGGFSQYFVNSSAESASFVVEAFLTIGAHNTANICRQAIIAAFPDELPLAVEDIQSVAKHFSKEVLAKLDSLDQEFYSYPDEVTDLLFSYVSAHPQEFGDLPKPVEG
jgi:hypothetical protein